MFCNKSAEKLLTRAVSLQSRTSIDQGAVNNSKRKKHMTECETSFESRIVKPRIFHPVKISEKDQKVKKFTEMFDNCADGATANLEDIITA